MIKYIVFDKKTGEQIGKPLTSRKLASKKVDRLDDQYGGYRYGYKMIEIK